MVKEFSPTPPAERKPPSVHPYSPTDPIPVPEAVESDGDTLWGLWEDSIAPARTEPAKSLPTPPGTPDKRQP